MHSSARRALECIDTKKNSASSAPTTTTTTTLLLLFNRNPTETLQEPYRNPKVVIVVAVVVAVAVVVVVVEALRAPFFFCINAF